MTLGPLILACLVVPAEPPAGGAPQALLEQALTLAQSIPDAAARADAVGRVAAELARTDPRRALALVSKEMATHEQSEAMARASETLAQDNRLLGLATLIRIQDRSSVLAALGRIIGMEALTDFQDALDLVAKIDTLTVRRDVEREVARVLWAELPGDTAAAIRTAVAWAEQVTDPVTRDEALAYAAQGAARELGVDAAAEVVQQMSAVGDARELAWGLVVQEVGARDPVGAQALLGRIGSVFYRSLAAASVVRGLAAAGKREAAFRLAAEIRSAVGKGIEDPRDQGLILGETALAIADVDTTAALSLLSEVYPPVRRYTLQSRVARLVGRKDPEAARELLLDAWVEVRRNDSPLIRRQIVAEAAATAEEVAPDFAAMMAKEMPDVVQGALSDAVLLLAPRRLDLALKLADRIADPAAAEQARARLAVSLAAAQPDAARRLLAQLATPAAQSRVLAALAAATRGGVD